LLEPIYEAQFDSVRAPRVKAMDETPITAGRGKPGKPGKLKAAYFWPVHGELDEVCLPFFESRRAEHVEQALGLTHAQGAVLLSDGYAAACWSASGRPRPRTDTAIVKANLRQQSAAFSNTYPTTVNKDSGCLAVTVEGVRS
jgi:Transposase IS66 family